MSKRIMYAVVAHDAGGAEFLSSYIRQKNLECHFVLAGPAVNIFKRKLDALEITQMENAISKSDRVLCGTSWQSTLELNAISLARKLNKKSSALIDHWVNYRERFERDGITILPDEVWVGDIAAKKIANTAFPDLPLRLIQNSYLLECKSELKACMEAGGYQTKQGRVLYIGENISGHAFARYGDPMYFGYTEMTAFNYLIKNIHLLGINVHEIVVRPHPSQNADKYISLLSGLPYKISVTQNTSLVQDISEAEVIVGCSSYALVIASLSQKMVVSCIPPNMKFPLWPCTEIIELRKLRDTRSTSRQRRDYFE